MNTLSLHKIKNYAGHDRHLELQSSFDVIKQKTKNHYVPTWTLPLTPLDIMVQQINLLLPRNSKSCLHQLQGGASNWI